MTEIIREDERLKMTGLSRVQWWRLEKAGTAPSRVQLGPNSIGWVKSEVLEWISLRIAARPAWTPGVPVPILPPRAVNGRRVKS